MKKVKDIFLKIITISFFILFLWITFSGIFTNMEIVYKLKSGMVILGTLIYIAIAMIIYKTIIPKMRKYKFIKYIIFLGLLILYISFACYFRLEIKWENSEEYTWDMGNVFNSSLELAQTGKVQDTYLLTFPNNIMLTLLNAIVLKLALLINANIDTIFVITIYNAIIVWITILLTYLVAKEIFDDDRANMFLIIALFTMPFYFYTPVFYTDTMSMFFLILMTYLCVKINKCEENSKQKIILQGILGVVSVIGMKVKLTSIFILIAASIYILLTWNWKKALKNIVSIMPTFIITLVIINIVSNQLVYYGRDDSTFKVPKLHWVMIGLNENGSFSPEDYTTTMTKPTYEEKEEAEIQSIKEKISQYNAKTFLIHLNDKLIFAWGDGTYYGPIKLERMPHKFGVLHDVVLRYGKYNKYFKYIPQAMHFGMLIFILINTFFIIKEKRYSKNINIIFIITICGFLAFLLIWENRSRYVITALPIMLLLEVEGINYLNIKSKRRKELEE